MIVFFHFQYIRAIRVEKQAVRSRRQLGQLPLIKLSHFKGLNGIIKRKFFNYLFYKGQYLEKYTTFNQVNRKSKYLL